MAAMAYEIEPSTAGGSLHHSQEACLCETLTPKKVELSASTSQTLKIGNLKAHLKTLRAVAAIDWTVSSDRGKQHLLNLLSLE